jgi:iron complex outermembrane receptor protein
LAGIRAERYFQDSVNNGSGSHVTETDYPVSPRLGLVYQPVDSLSLYGSYVRSFVPVDPSAVNFEGRQFKPGQSHQWEGGIKVASPSGRLSSTIALYQIEKNNVIAPDPTNPLFSVQNGQERSKGVELEFQGSPMPGLRFLTSYAYTIAKVTQSTQYPVGNIKPNSPRNSGAVWVSYQPQSGTLRNLGVNVGVVAVGDRQDTYYNTALLPRYGRVDFGAFYDIRVQSGQTFRVGANVQNVLNQVYYLASNGQNQVRPGAPVSALVSLQWIRQ